MRWISATLGLLLAISAPLTAAYGQDITSTRFNTPEGREALATMINLNGRLCARVVGLSGTVSRPIVECIESRNGTTRVTYVIDMDSGRVLR